MGNSLIAWQNYCKNATITASTAATNLPAGNVAGDSGSPSLGWQSVSGDFSGTTLTIVPSLPGQPLDVVGLFRSNLSATAIVQFDLYTGGAVTYTQLFTPALGYGSVVCVLPVGTVADSIVISFTDGNPDGFINVPMVFAGPAWRPLGSCSFQSTLGRDVSDTRIITRGGQLYDLLYYTKKRFVVSLSMRTSEAWAFADQMAIYAASGSNVLFIPDVTSPYLQQEAVFGTVTATDFGYPSMAADRRSWTFTVVERL